MIAEIHKSNILVFLYSDVESNENTDSSRPKFVGIDVSILNDESQFPKDYLAKQEKQKRMWDIYMSKNGKGVDLIKTSHLQSLVNDGIPDDLRGTCVYVCMLVE